MTIPRPSHHAKWQHFKNSTSSVPLADAKPLAYQPLLSNLEHSKVSSLFFPQLLSFCQSPPYYIAFSTKQVLLGKFNVSLPSNVWLLVCQSQWPQTKPKLESIKFTINNCTEARRLCLIHHSFGIKIFTAQHMPASFLSSVDRFINKTWYLSLKDLQFNLWDRQVHKQFQKSDNYHNRGEQDVLTISKVPVVC